MKNILNKVEQWYKTLPDKKHHVEFITAVLSVPVMITVIILNLNNLNQKNAAQKQTLNGTVTPIQVIIKGDKQSENSNNTALSPTSPASIITPTPSACIKEVGPVSILSPRENEVVTKNPICITLATQSNYCSITWSYSLDGGDWSDYTDKNICLYNLTNGTRTIQVKIKSTVSNDTTTLQRSFIYQGNNAPPANQPTATSSASL